MSDPIFYGKPLTFNPNNHRYRWGTEYVPSVTTILNRLSKPLLIQWAADKAAEHFYDSFRDKPWEPGNFDDLALRVEAAKRAHTVIRDEAGDVGHLVHEYAKDLMMGRVVRERDALPMQAAHAIAALHAWKKKHRIEPLGVERRIFSRQLMYAGTCDFHGRIDGNLAVLDFKTGNGVYDEAWYQMAGYNVALDEEHDEQPENAFGDLGRAPPMDHWLVHLNKNTGECKTYVRQSNETLAARKVWLSLVELDRGIRAMPKMEKLRSL